VWTRHQSWEKPLDRPQGVTVGRSSRSGPTSVVLQRSLKLTRSKRLPLVNSKVRLSISSTTKLGLRRSLCCLLRSDPPSAKWRSGLLSGAPGKMSPAQELNTSGGLLRANTVANLPSASAKLIGQNRIFGGSERQKIVLPLTLSGHKKPEVLSLT